MDPISPKELFELYIDTVSRFTRKLLELSDDDIAYELFEQFDIGAISFLHENTLNTLRAAGFIDDNVVELSKTVRAKWFDIKSRSDPWMWSAEQTRTGTEWHELFDLCEQIMKSISNRNGDAVR